MAHYLLRYEHHAPWPTCCLVGRYHVSVPPVGPVSVCRPQCRFRPQLLETTTHGRLCSHWPISNSNPRPRDERKCQGRWTRGIRSWLVVGLLLPPDETSPSRPRSHPDRPAGRPRMVWMDGPELLMPPFLDAPSSCFSCSATRIDGENKSTTTHPSPMVVPLGSRSRTEGGCTGSTAHLNRTHPFRPACHARAREDDESRMFCF